MTELKRLRAYETGIRKLSDLNSKEWVHCSKEPHYHLVLREMLSKDPQVMFMINPLLRFDDSMIDLSLKGRITYLSSKDSPTRLNILSSDEYLAQSFPNISITLMDQVLEKKPQYLTSEYITDGKKMVIANQDGERVFSFNQPQFANKIVSLYLTVLHKEEELTRREENIDLKLA